MIGGSLARPAEQHPDIFGNSEFLKKYPYILACAVPAIFSAICWLVIFFFLKETVKNPTPIFQLLKNKYTKGKPLPTCVSDSEDATQIVTSDGDKPLPLRSLLTERVIIAASNYALLALVEINYRAIQPVFLATPVALGGLGLSPSVIGNILSTYGVVNGIFQVFFFAKIVKHWGAKKTYLVGLVFSVPAVALFPILSLLVRRDGLSGPAWVLLMVHTLIPIGMSMSYGMPIRAGSSVDVPQETVALTLCRSNIPLHSSSSAEQSFTRCHERVEPGKFFP